MKNRNYKAQDETIGADVTNFDTQETKEEKKEIKKEEPKRAEAYIIRVTNLALRVGPGKEFDMIGIATAGHTLIDEIKNNFGHISDGSGWVCMDYLMKVN